MPQPHSLEASEKYNEIVTNSEVHMATCIAG